VRGAPIIGLLRLAIACDSGHAEVTRRDSQSRETRALASGFCAIGWRSRGSPTEIEPRSGEQRSQPQTEEGAVIALFERVVEASVRGP
jgi:hypothetical protein